MRISLFLSLLGLLVISSCVPRGVLTGLHPKKTLTIKVHGKKKSVFNYAYVDIRRKGKFKTAWYIPSGPTSRYKVFYGEILQVPVSKGYDIEITFKTRVHKSKLFVPVKQISRMMDSDKTVEFWYGGDTGKIAYELETKLKSDSKMKGHINYARERLRVMEGPYQTKVFDLERHYYRKKDSTKLKKNLFRLVKKKVKHFHWVIEASKKLDDAAKELLKKEVSNSASKEAKLYE